MQETPESARFSLVAPIVAERCLFVGEEACGDCSSIETDGSSIEALVSGDDFGGDEERESGFELVVLCCLSASVAAVVNEGWE